ncbi:hypothetical protein [Nannocystis pusilla]|uniref:Uncharacterized protein n=1 Tax=Nannocystis pusilla TaxID=889268 RepID=A0ABS7TNB6_9BACT|nr:hypothetical protein [Nannocystis pusilla]MBZ5709723.1 hypothetical protein [Nannocystis pusilla]
MRDLKFSVCLIAALIGACGDSGRPMDSAGATDGPGISTAAPGGSTGPTPTTSDGSTVGQGGDVSTSTSTTGSVDEPTAASTTPEPATSSTGPVSAGESSGSSDTGESGCVIGDVEDTLAFTYTKSIDLAPIDTIQASFYNQDAQEIVFFSYFGPGRRYSLDGTPLGDVMAPPEALPALDGASFDQIKRVGMLITQGCAVVDIDPVTMETLEVLQLDVVKFGLQTCAGVAIGVDGSMYVTSFFTDEVVVMTRDGQTELDRIDLAAVGLPRPDGISLIAGSDNFLILSTTGIQSAILTPKGEVIVGPAPTGQDLPPMIGGGITNPDAVLTVCGNGHAWLCDEYGTLCHDYVPMDGDKDACACTIPQ